VRIEMESIATTAQYWGRDIRMPRPDSEKPPGAPGRCWLAGSGQAGM